MGYFPPKMKCFSDNQPEVPGSWMRTHPFLCSTTYPWYVPLEILLKTEHVGALHDRIRRADALIIMGLDWGFGLEPGSRGELREIKRLVVTLSFSGRFKGMVCDSGHAFRPFGLRA